MTDMSNGSREIVVVGFDLHVLLFPDYMSLPSLGHKKKEGKDYFRAHLLNVQLMKLRDCF